MIKSGHCRKVRVTKAHFMFARFAFALEDFVGQHDTYEFYQVLYEQILPTNALLSNMGCPIKKECFLTRASVLSDSINISLCLICVLR